jgi:hypothetical protein
MASALAILHFWSNKTVEVRFVDQKPTLHKVWGIGPERKSSDAREFENLIPVSV